MSKKKIAIVSRTLSMNGATKALVEMLKKVDANLFNIDLYVLDFTFHCKALADEIPDWIRIIPIKKYNASLASVQKIAKYPIHFAKSLFAAVKLRTDMRKVSQFKYTAMRLPRIEKRYDVAISYRHFDIDVFFVQNNIVAQKKYFWVHGVQPLEEERTDVLRKIYTRYDGVFPVSIAARDNICKYFPELSSKCTIAYSVVDADMIRAKAETGLRFTDNKLVIYTIARLGEEKGIDLAVETAKILKKNQHEFRWYVAGDGSERKKLQRLIVEYGLQEEFVLMGNIDNPYGYLQSCDIYVQPSYLESYGLTVNEAKIEHKPIVCTDIPAMKEQIVHNETGLIADINAASMAKNIEAYIDNADLRKRVVRNLSMKDWSHFEAVSVFEAICGNA